MIVRDIHIEGRTWHLRIYGSGEHLLIALHGFGETGAVFQAWEKSLGRDYTIAAVDLPYHGGSVDWPPDSFTPDVLTAMIRHLAPQHQGSGYSLVAHSFGARVLISCIERLPSRPAVIWLLAPDGLATQRMTLPDLAPIQLRRWMARRIDRHYAFWIKLSGFVRRLQLIDDFSVRYVRHHLSDQLRRRRLMGTWCSLPRFAVDRQELLAMAQGSKPAIQLVIGRSDALIDWSKLEDWLEQWPSARLHRLPAGHALVNEQTANLLRREIRRE